MMKINTLQACDEYSPKWETAIKREGNLKAKDNEVRSEFTRDYNRILHSKAYRRLKHKTQVFYATQNDHVCTRIEHVNHVSSVSYTIAKALNLNTELTQAIALGHDLGHAPFGHQGERILKEITKKDNLNLFWHERNSLHFVDNIETLQNPDGSYSNMDLTYAVRDGILLHCGEVDEKAIIPRNQYIDLQNVDAPNIYSPYTYEASIVKVSDKIAYLGRDIEDAQTLKLLDKKQVDVLIEILNSYEGIKIENINNTSLIHRFITDLIENSNENDGIKFSEDCLKLITHIKDFNYTNIYKHKRLAYFNSYVELIIMSIYNELKQYYDGRNTINVLNKHLESKSDLRGSFIYDLEKYSDINPAFRESKNFKNKIIYDLNNEKDYQNAIITYISSMTDHFAIKLFAELTRF